MDIWLPGAIFFAIGIAVNVAVWGILLALVWPV